MSLLVMKFGGTSLGTPAAMNKAAAIVQSQATRQKVVVVVSALAGVTNQLIEAAHQSACDREQVVNKTRIFLKHHLDHLAGLNLPDTLYKPARRSIESNAILLYNILFSAYQTGSASPAIVDEALALGELTSASIFTRLLQSLALSAGEVDARKLIFTDDQHTNARVNFSESNQTILKRIPSLLAEYQSVTVPGFVGISSNGHTTTLGRGASDYTASILAAALNADEVWNWTDVDGVYTADPRVQPDAKLIPILSYDAMATLALQGAKVLHPDTVAPLVEQRIPLRVRNTFHPERSGTLIQHQEGAASILEPTHSPGSFVPVKA